MKPERTRNDSKSCRYIVYFLYIDKHTQYVCVYMYIYIYVYHIKMLSIDIALL